jgi:CRP/FNR family transcriptional regulator, cyclic AMP receptor protein
MTMSDDLLERLGRHVPAGTVLFREGEIGTEMYVVHSGRVEITRRMRDRDAHLMFVPPGEFFGEMAIVNNRPRSATATAVEETWLLVIDARTFEMMIRARAEIAVRMIRLLAARLEQSNRQVELLLLRDADHRVARCLWQLSEAITPIDDVGIHIPITLEQLAGRVALDPETVEEVITRLSENRLLARREDGFVVPEVGRLQEFLEFLEMKERFL